MKKELLFFEYNEVIFIRGSRIIKSIIKPFTTVFKYKPTNNTEYDCKKQTFWHYKNNNLRRFYILKNSSGMRFFNIRLFLRFPGISRKLTFSSKFPLNLLLKNTLHRAKRRGGEEEKLINILRNSGELS